MLSDILAEHERQKAIIQLTRLSEGSCEADVEAVVDHIINAALVEFGAKLKEALKELD